MLAAEQIARALHRHPAKVTVIVPHYAMSGGTMLALAADEILMDENAVLGPVDPQIGQWPAASIIKVAETKPIERVERRDADPRRHRAQGAAAGEGVRHSTCCSTTSRPSARTRSPTTSRPGKWTHDYPLTLEALAEIGLPVSNELPKEVFGLMDLYPQLGNQRPSVQYVPLPYPDPQRTAPSPARPRQGDRD